MRRRLQSGVGLLTVTRTLLTLAALAVAAPQATAQPRPTRPDAPPHYAIRGARIVTVSGRTIENGTVVVENGMITAVGSNVAVPASARVIDGSGKTVYPGLFDAFTTLGHGSAAPAVGGFFGGGGPDGGDDDPNQSWGPEDRPGTLSWVSAGEDLDPDDDRFDSWREGGFTSVLSTLPEGLVTGQAALLNLGSYVRPREMVVATPVAMRLNLFDRSFSGYPGSLMGVFAYLKQLYMDADHYGKVWEAYESSPVGQRRPEWDVALEPIRQQIREGWPVLFPADDRVEIGRAINTAKAMGVRPIIYGAQAAFGAADVLAANNLPVLVNLDWPSSPSGGDPEAVPSLAQLRLWDRATTTPKALADAGVNFAFYSGGLDGPAEMLTAARKAVAQGLSEDAAIRAFTLAPAQILGVGDRLGSIETGKIANLVMTSGSLFAEGTLIETVFVDGEPFEIRQTVAAGNGRGRAGGRGGRGGGGRGGQGDQGGAGGGDDEASAADGPPIPMSQDKGTYHDDAVTFIRNATIMTASHGTIRNGDMILRDGKIAEVGTGLTAPRGATVVDATGKFVTPGIIDAHSHLAAAAINEGSVNSSAMVSIRDVIDPDDGGIYFALAGGVTAMNILHGSANPIGGQNAVVKLRWGADADALLIEDATPGIKFALGENTKRNRNPPRYPATRMGVQDVIRQSFLDAVEYKRVWDEYEAGGMGGMAPRVDLEMQALKEILEGKRDVHSHSYRADEILQLIRLADEFGFTIRTFQHVLEGYKVADEIATHGAGASTFSDWWAYKVEAYDAIPYNAALMAERGVLVSINSDSGEEIRHLNQEAAKAMKWGDMEEEPALRLVTLNPAIQLRIDHRTGSIDVGKDADVVIWDGHPLSIFTKAVQTYVDGKVYFDLALDPARQAAIQAEKDALMKKHGVGAAGSGPSTDRVASPGNSGGEVIR